jgi:hypothetical protein
VKPWEKKAHKLIAELCLASWRQANVLPNGKRRKRHVPYSRPVTAQALVDALGKNDEHKAKAIFQTIADRQMMSATWEDIS